MGKRGGSERVNAELLQQLCQTRGWWSKELANATGLSVRKCQQLLEGGREGKGTIATIKVIADIFGYGVEDLFEKSSISMTQEAFYPKTNIVIDIFIESLARTPITITRRKFAESIQDKLLDAGFEQVDIMSLGGNGSRTEILHRLIEHETMNLVQQIVGVCFKNYGITPRSRRIPGPIMDTNNFPYIQISICDDFYSVFDANPKLE